MPPDPKPGSKPCFHVGDLPIYGDVVLAPMAGFADVPSRHICRQFGSAMSYTEFVAAEDIINGAARAASLLDFVDDDRPMVFQIFGNDARRILLAAQIIEERGPDIIDINMGCSTRRVSGRGAGVGMMRDPDLIAETFRLLTKHLTVPVSGKIRLGWEEQQNYLEVGRILEDNGAALVAIHPRTKEQKYHGQANWEAIANLREELTIPVIGNGDISEPQQIDQMLAETGCQGVMIARGALGNPWMFARQDKRNLKFVVVTKVIRDHLAQMIIYHGPRGLILFRKHVKRYLVGMRPVKPHCRQLVRAETLDQFEATLTAAELQFGDFMVAQLMD